MGKLAEGRRKEIMEAALQLFLEKGYEKTAIKDITEKMNIATGLFHYYFRSKEDVLIECAIWNSQLITEELELETFFEGKGNAVDKINLLMGQVLHNVSERSQMIKESAKISTTLLFDRIVYTTLDIIIQKLIEFIEEGNEEQIFQCAYPREAAEIFVYGVERQFRKEQERNQELWEDCTISEYVEKHQKKIGDLFGNLLCMKQGYQFSFDKEKVCSKEVIGEKGSVF